MSGVLKQLKKSVEEEERREKKLGNKATITALKAGPTQAVEIVGEPPEPYLEALLAGVTDGFTATIQVHGDTLPQRLLAHGADVRVGPPPKDDQEYRLTAYQDDGVVSIMYKSKEAEKKTWSPYSTGSRASLKLNLRDFACYDGESVATSLDALPKQKRTALERRIYKSPEAFMQEVTPLMIMSYASPVVGWLLCLFGFVFSMIQAFREGPLLVPFLITALGVLLIFSGRLVDKKLDALLGSGKDP